MNGTLSPTEWLDVIRDEYLDTFVRDGGSTVKFAVHTDGASVTATGVTLLQIATNAGYLTASIDAKETRVHMPQNLFFRIAEQVDWRLLARKMVVHLLAQRGYGVANVDPTDPANLVGAIATTTDLEPDFILSVASPLIQRSVFRDRGMSQDFRVAMSHLCIEALSGDFIDSDSHPILTWLTGEQRGISGVRPFSIHTAINRTNARHFTESLFHWARQVGYTGTAIILDDSRVTLPTNPKDGKVFYTRALVMDHYELLRELIDSTDRLDGMFMSVLADRNSITRTFLARVTPSTPRFGRESRTM